MSNPKIKALAHICLLSPDLEATKRFYLDCLGLSIQFEFIRDGKPFGYYFKIAEDQFIEIFKMDDPQAPGDNAAFAHFCLETDDIHALKERLAEHSYEPSEVTMGCDNSLQCWVRDPSGVRFEFHQYGPESLQRVGGSVAVN